MAKQSRALLGIDITPYEIRVAEFRTVGKQDQIVQVGSTRTPAGSMHGDRIADPGAVASTLRGLINRMAVSTKAAVVGIGPQQIITHVLDIPHVPEDEVRTVVEGELAHLHVLPSGTGAFDYLKIDAPPSKEDGAPQALVMAAESKTVAAAAEVATLAGLQLVAIEPSLAAMYRFAYPQLHDQASAAFVSVGYSKSEIAILDHGQIRLYRRADIGTDEMIKGRQGMLAAAKAGMENMSGRVMLGEHQEEVQPDSEDHISGGINNTKAGTFAVEVKRSIDYFRREFPRATPLSVIYLAANDPDAADLAPWLKQSLDTEVILCEPAQMVHTIPTVALQMEIPGGLRFSSAIGLALTGAIGMAGRAPKFDLSAHERLSVAAEVSRKTLVMVGALCVFILAAGTLGTMALKARVASTESTLNAKINAVRLKKLENATRLGNLKAEQESVSKLVAKGFPIPSLMDEVSGSIDPEAGLIEVNLEPNGRLTVKGEATNQRAVVDTVKRMQASPSFAQSLIDNSSTSTAGKTRVIQFQISSQLYQAQIPGAPKAAQ